MPKGPAELTPESMLRLANEPSRDALRDFLRVFLHPAAIKARTMGSVGGGELTHRITLRLLEASELPPAVEMSGEGSDDWPSEFFSLIRFGDSFAPWQAFACWVCLLAQTDAELSLRLTAEDETVLSLVEAARRIGPAVCASAIAFLVWQAPQRSEAGPRSFHELAIVLLYADLFRGCPVDALRGALQRQSDKMIRIADAETLKAVESGEIYDIHWPLDISQSTAAKPWLLLCRELLSPCKEAALPPAAEEILRRIEAGV